MAYYDLAWFTNSVGYTAVTAWAATTVIAAGALRRQLAAPAVNNERVFVAIVGGTTGSTEPAWTLTRGAKSPVDGTVTWQECTGASAVNGDVVDTPNWTAAKVIGAPSLGAIIQRNSGASYQICTTAGTFGAAEPAFSNTAGVTTSESGGTAVWTSLGVVGAFTGGQAPHARLASACASTWFAAGNTIYVGDNHAESQATAVTITPAVANTAGRILCHNHSGAYPPASSDLATGATVSTTATVNMTLTLSGGSFYVYGMTFKAGVGASGSSALLISTSGSGFYYFDNCLFQISTTNTVNQGVTVGNGAGVVVFNNTKVSFQNTSQFVSHLTSQFIWQNTASVLATGSAVPNNFINATTAGSGVNTILEALDLSQLTGTIFALAGFATTGNHLMKDCKLNASAIPAALGVSGQSVQLVRSDSSGTGYKSARYTLDGTETTETSITRVGGAVDPSGQAQSRKIVTTANSQWLRPFKAEPYAVWNPVTGANVTVTVSGTVNAGALPNNDDIWLEVEYLGSSATPLGTIISTTKANLLAANAAVASDGSTWNGGGSGAGWSPFKLVAVLSSPQPGMAGYLHARVRAAKPSATYYLDPKVQLS